MKFYKWYTEALGSIFGIMACVYSYLRGFLLLYSKLDGNYELISFGGVISSYLLLPLCILTFIFSSIISVSSNLTDKKFLNVKIEKYNDSLIYLTCFIGLIGCNIYFLIPCFFLLFSKIVSIIKYFNINKKHNSSKNINSKNEKHKKNKNGYDNHKKDLFFKKREMALELLKDSSDIIFISEVTGLSPKYIQNLKNIKNKTNQYN